MMRVYNFFINTLIYVLITLWFVTVPVKSQTFYWNQTTLSFSANNNNKLTVLTSTLTYEEIETVVTYKASLSTATVTTGGVITQYTTWCPLTSFTLTTSTTPSFSVSQSQNFFYSGYSKSLNNITLSNSENTVSKVNSNSVNIITSSPTTSSNINFSGSTSFSTLNQLSDSSYSISPATATLPYSETIDAYASNNSSKFLTIISHSSSLYFGTETTNSATTSELSRSGNTTTTSMLISRKSSVPLSIPTSSSILLSLTTFESISTKKPPSMNTTSNSNIPTSEVLDTITPSKLRMSPVGLFSVTSSLHWKSILTPYISLENTSIESETYSSKLSFTTTSYTSSVITIPASDNITSRQSKLPLTSSASSNSQILSASANYSILTITTTSNGIVTLYTTWCPLAATSHENIQSFKEFFSSPLSTVITTTDHPETSVNLSSDVKSSSMTRLHFSQNITSKTKATSVSTESSFTLLSSSSPSSSPKEKSLTVSNIIITTYLHSTFTSTKEGVVTVVTTWCPVTSTKIISIESCSKDQCILSSSNTTNLISHTRNKYTSTITVISTRRRSSMVDVPKFRQESSSTALSIKQSTVFSIESCSNGECRIADTSTTSSTSSTFHAGCSNGICTVISSNIQVSSMELSSTLMTKEISCSSGICTTSITDRTKESITPSSEYNTSTTTSANLCQDGACALSVRSFTTTSGFKPAKLSMLTKTNRITSTAVTLISIESCIDGKCSISSSMPSSLHSAMISKSIPLISRKITSSITTVTTTFHGMVTQYTTWCPLLVTCEDDQCELADSTGILVEKFSSTVSISNKYTTSIVINKLTSSTEADFSFITSVSTTHASTSVQPTTSKKVGVFTTTNCLHCIESSVSKKIITNTVTNQEEKQSPGICTGLQCTTIPESISKDSICTTCSTTLISVHLTPIMATDSDTSTNNEAVIITTISDNETTNTIKSNSFNTQVLTSNSIESTNSIETISSSFADSAIKSCSNAGHCYRVTSNPTTSGVFSSSHAITYNVTPVITTYVGSAKRITIFGNSMISLLLLLII